MAIEIPLRTKYTQHTVKQQKSTLNKSGPAGGKKSRITNGMSGVMREQLKLAAAAETTRNQMILVILPSGKRRFMRLSEYTGT